MLNRTLLFWSVVVPAAGVLGVVAVLAVGSDETAAVYVVLFFVLPALATVSVGALLRVWKHLIPGAVAAALVGGAGWFLLLWMAAQAGLFDN
jgi:hypothetical protein